MLVREVITDAKTGIVTERMVERADVVTPEAQAIIDQQSAVAALTVATNEQTIGQRVDAALSANDTYLAIASPTNPQVVAQVNKLTRECSAMIRLLRRKLDSVSGT